MAGEWIKMAVGLRTHPKVVRMATMLKADRLRVVGGLHAVWGLFDTHSVEGRLDGYTPEVMDADLGWKGFTAAMVAIGWLSETDDGLAAPDYEEHNGPVAKRRAMETSRKGRSRKTSADCPQDTDDECGHLSACDADKLRNREEKRREEQKTKTPRKRAAPAVLVSVDALVADGVEPQHAADWLAVRKVKNLPLTPTAWQETQAEAVKAGLPIGAAIKRAAAEGWGGFKASWLARDAAGHSRNGADPADAFSGAH